MPNSYGTKVIVSEIDPEVKYTIRTFSEGMRKQLERLSEQMSKLDALYMQVVEFNDANGFTGLSTEEAAKRYDELGRAARRELDKLTQLIDIAHEEVQPIQMQAGFVSVEGLFVDGKPAQTVEQLLGVSTAFYGELAAAVRSELGLVPGSTESAGLPSGGDAGSTDFAYR